MPFLKSFSRRSLLAAGGAGVAALAVRASASTPGPYLMDATSKSLGYLRVGQGKIGMIILHEWLGDHRNYNEALRWLSKKTRERYTIVFADLRGYGLSKEMAGEYTRAEAVADVLATADTLGWAKFHLGGHSMSGHIAQYMAMKARARVESLYLCSPVPATAYHATPEDKAKFRAVVDDDAELEKAVNGRTGGKLGRGFIEGKAEIARTSATKAALAGYLDMFTDPANDFADEIAAAPQVKDMLVTALCGANDALVYRPDAQRAALERAFGRGGNVEVIADDTAGHYSMLETAPLWASTLEHHLSRVEAKTASSL
jgi:pimeloyl-ACP methyl ester carboxylesterase